MANQTENKTVRNFVKLEGWLKDNTLAEMVTSTQKNAINGQLIIATSATEEYRIRLFAAKTLKEGAPNPNYEALKQLLPSNTCTIKHLLETNEGAKFEDVLPQASKVWATGSFSVYDRKDEGGEIHTSITLQGMKAGFKKEGALAKPFAPCATFDCEGYLKQMADEKEGETETGRLKISLLIPDYFHETVMPIDFIAPADIKDPILQAWNIGDTVSLKGKLCNTRKEVAPQRAARTSLTGNTETLEPTFIFVNERVVTDPYPSYDPDDVKYIKAETINSYLVNREKMLSELEVSAQNDTRQPLATSTTAPTSTPASKGFEI